MLTFITWLRECKRGFFPVKLNMFPFIISHLIVGKYYRLKFDRTWNITVHGISDKLWERSFISSETIYNVTGFCFCLKKLKYKLWAACPGESFQVVIRGFLLWSVYLFGGEERAPLWCFGEVVVEICLPSMAPQSTLKRLMLLMLPDSLWTLVISSVKLGD